MVKRCTLVQLTVPANLPVNITNMKYIAVTYWLIAIGFAIGTNSNLNNNVSAGSPVPIIAGVLWPMYVGIYLAETAKP